MEFFKENFANIDKKILHILIIDATNLDYDFYMKNIAWDKNPDNKLIVLQYIAECTGCPFDQMIEWKPDKGAPRVYDRWEKKMARRWNRYKRYWMDTTRMCKKQNYDMDFKKQVLTEYYNSNLSLREIAEKYDIEKNKIRVWAWQTMQV